MATNEPPKLPVVHRPGQAGRPPYDDSVRKKILTSLKMGLPRASAYRAEGIGEATFYVWLRDIDGFREAVEAAEHYAHKIYVGRLARDARAGDGRATRFFLERRFPQDWRERSTVTIANALEEDLEEAIERDTRSERLRNLAREALRRADRGADRGADPDGSDDRGPDPAR